MNKDLHDSTKYGLVVLSISRQEIEAFDHTPVLEALSEIEQHALHWNGRLNMVVNGYDDDSRELHEIREVRDYFDFLDRCFPYWFYFLARTLPARLSTISLLVALLVPITTVADRNAQLQTVAFDIPKLQEFLEIHFFFLNEITQRLGLSKEENKRISLEILEAVRALVR